MIASLFQIGQFKLHSGNDSIFKIDCDALSIKDWEAIARIVSLSLGPWQHVEGVPSGGIMFAKALSKYNDDTSNLLLIADDVLTTGNSMEEHRANRTAVGIVLFSRGQCPNWITSVFKMTSKLK